MAPDVATIRKVREPFGALGNMSAHGVDTTADTQLPPVLRRDWRSSEALFQALRFWGDNHETVDDIIIDIWRHKSPMGAKIVARTNRERMLTEPLSASDLFNMRGVLERKLAAHPVVQTVLESTAGLPIVEDCSNRMGGSGLFWGAALMHWGRWVGENWLGRLWTDIRDGVPWSEPDV